MDGKYNFGYKESGVLVYKVQKLDLIYAHYQWHSINTIHLNSILNALFVRDYTRN